MPRFDPSNRPHTHGAERRRRLLFLASTAVIVALIASSVTNATRMSLQCHDGVLIPFRGRLLPVGDEPLNDEGYPPFSVSEGLCEDEPFDDRRSFERRYAELAYSPAEASKNLPADPDPNASSESILHAIEALSRLPAGTNESLLKRRRALLERMVQHKIDQVRQHQHDALKWIEHARQAGVDPATLRAAERSLGLIDTEAPKAPAVDPSLDEPTADPPVYAVKSSTRSL